MQTDMGMRVNVFDTAPRFGRHNLDAEFFDEFALECIEYAFTRLDFAAGEFPITLVWLARRALSEQDVAIRFHQDTDRDVDGSCCHSFR